MSNAVCFSTPGLADITALTTFGVNAKEGSNPIGYFGTGFKYAVALILRNGGSIVMCRGNKYYQFSKKQHTIRNKEFDIVTLECVDESPIQLGFTTDLGKNWRPWMAYRELYCNTVDENGTIDILGLDAFCTEVDRTRFIVTGWNDFVEAHHQRAKYFLHDAKPKMLAGDSHNVNVYAGNNDHIYFKGIRAHDGVPGKKSKYTYNVLGGMTLTEERMLSSNPLHSYIPYYYLNECEDTELIHGVLTCGDEFAEGVMSWDLYGTPSDKWLEVAATIERDRVYKLSASARDKLFAHRKSIDLSIAPAAVALDNFDIERLSNAIAFCKALGYHVDSYDIIVAEHLGPLTLGEAHRSTNTIYLSKRVFTQGVVLLAQTLIEEYFHLAYGLDDETRNMQNFLFEQLVELGQRVIGKSL